MQSRMWSPGKVGPSGRTAVTWPRTLGQVPVFFGERPSGRPADPKDRFTSKYLDVSNEPLFPFGHGLSYGRFTLSNLRLTSERITEKDTVVVRVDVLNDGARAAEETVFLFTHEKLAAVTRPLLELKGFAKIKLEPGQTGTVTLFLAATELRFLGPDLRARLRARGGGDSRRTVRGSCATARGDDSSGRLTDCVRDV